MEYSNLDQVINVLGGVVSTRVIKHSERSFAFEVTLDLAKGSEFFAQKPPLHFHANQDEYIQAVQGNTGLELEGREIVLTPGSPEYCIPSWANHRSYPMPMRTQDGVNKVKFLLSGAQSPEPFQLNLLFFENWYRYQESVVTGGKKIDIIQVLSTFDGGGTYLSFPSWVPFGRKVSQILGVVVDWALACHEMEASIFQRRFAQLSKTD
ncbi:hypothetical protein UCREL1_10273 [Eutypa lata UCREL1]|uniref:Cupin domain-containing protein n=1 Tax=Eutypa lata (strain UCR-EL1) TaxID=1287681 RepID=M7SF60_EUTLA|nr:hypothetical protein UCREL1_10273 [Eutypa lata UCREL1]